MKQTAFFLGTLASALILFSAAAADAPAVPGGSRTDESRDGGRRFRPGRDGMERRGDPRAEAEAQIKEKFPAEYAEIEKLRAEADAKLRELAKKAGIEIPKTFAEQMAEEPAYGPMLAELGDQFCRFAERVSIQLCCCVDNAAFRKMRELAEKAGIALPFGRPGQGPGRMGGRGDVPGEDAPRMRANPMQQLRQLRQKFPKEMAEVEELRRTDPAAARAKMQELIKQLEADRPARP